MSDNTHTTTVTLDVNSDSAIRKMEAFRRRIDEAQRSLEKLQDPKARDLAKANVEKYDKAVKGLTEDLTKAEKKLSDLNKTGAAPDLLKDAQKSVDQLKKNLQNAKNTLKDAKKELAEFDPKNVERAKKNVEQLKKELNEMRSSSEVARAVLSNLDKVSLAQLQKTLRTLNKQFREAEQGSEAYEELAGKIRMVKEQISAVQDDLKQSESLWIRFREWALKSWGAIDLIVRGGETIYDAFSDYIDAFAGMDQEMASVRKYTGMTEEQVARLNEEFRKMDTRTTREQLNMLAQDAGRLGKQSVEDVMGFVRAADKINVALDDLGDGATLTLSKLTGIFGYEEQYGTEQSLLKVGSVINELSQNCSASAPYIANFTERMAGVGAQANMTIPQIMGLAAVLDSNSQAVEASATSISQVLVHLYQDPAKYAKTAGLDVKEFTDLLKKDANAALIQFLEALNQAGGMDVLSPMFKDMGENGSRAIAALSTLAGKIEDVKAQQEVANEAFREGTSIGTEFDVQNSTVAASLDKCKNAAHEMQVELGERLYPLMAHILSSTAAVSRALLTVIRFLFDNKTAIISLTVAALAYVAVLKASAVHTKILAAETAVSKVVFTAWTAAVKLGSAAVGLMTFNVAKARTSWIAFNAVLKSNPIGIVISAVALLATYLTQLLWKTDEYKKAAEDAEASATSFAESLRKEQSEIDKLFGALEGAKKGTKEYNKAKEDIISRYGVYLQGLINEMGEITNLTEAYDRLAFAARKSAQERAIAHAQEQLQNAHAQDIDKSTEDLRKRLLDYGMDERNVTRIVTEVATAITSGQQVSGDLWKEIQEFQGQNQGWKVLSTKDSPMRIVDNLNKHLVDFNQRSEKLDKMFVRQFSGLSTEDLKKQVEIIDKAMSLPAGIGQNITIDLQVDGEDTARDIAKDYNTGVITSINSNDPNSLKSKGTTGGLSGYTPSNLSGGNSKVEDSLSWRTDEKNNYYVSGIMSRENAERMRNEMLYELSRRSRPSSTENTFNSGSGYTSSTLSEKERKKQEAEERRRQAKERKEFKEALDNIKGEREKAETQAMADRSAGLIDYRQYLDRMREAEVKFYDESSKLYVANDLAEDEDHMALLKKKQEADDKYNTKRLALNKDAIERIATIEERELKAKYDGKLNKSLADELAYSEQLLTIRYNKLMDLQQLYMKGSQEWEQYERVIQDLLYKDQQEKQAAIVKKAQEFREKFDKMSVAERYRLEIESLEKLYEMKKITEEQYQEWLKKLREEERKEQEKELPGSKPETPKSKVDDATREFERQKSQLNKALTNGEISQDEYDVRLARIKNSLFDNIIDPLKNAKSEWVSLMATMIDSWKDFADALQDPEGDPLGKLAKGMEATSALMGAVFSQMTAFMQAELQIQTAAVEKRYDKEVAAAEGNSYRVAKLEKEKEQELAKLKNEANRKMFAMQVIQAVAQTATNALNAYGSAAAIPVVGHIMAPIAAAMAVAAGMVQVAAIKKQQQAAETQGYSKGGFTKPGAIDEPAGIVHAGEWVASQKLLASPVARPMIEALDYAQRTNTIGSLRSEDVSRSMTATQSMARIADGNPSAALVAAAMASNSDVLQQLVDRLNVPFVTMATVAGDHGINKAQDEYSTLLRNKSPKSKKNANNR